METSPTRNLQGGQTFTGVPLTDVVTPEGPAGGVTELPGPGRDRTGQDGSTAELSSTALDQTAHFRVFQF